MTQSDLAAYLLGQMAEQLITNLRNATMSTTRARSPCTAERLVNLALNGLNLVC